MRYGGRETMKKIRKQEDGMYWYCGEQYRNSRLRKFDCKAEIKKRFNLKHSKYNRKMFIVTPYLENPILVYV